MRIHKDFSRGSYPTLTGEPDSGAMDPSGPDPANRAHAALARDAALNRVSHTRRWVILGSAGLSAGFAALVSASPPSHASTTSARSAAKPPAVTPRPSTGTRSKKAPALPPLANGSQLGLQGPSQAPGGDENQSSGAPDSSSQAPAQSAPSDQAQSAPAQPAAPSPQPGPVSGGS